MDRSNTWPAKKALYVIFGSVLLSCLVSSFVIFLVHRTHSKRAQDPKYELKKIVQTGPDKEALSHELLLEILGLNQVKANYYSFSEDAAKKALEGHMLIQKAHVEKIYPDTLYIDYVARAPYFRLLDYDNAALDAEARLIPLKPFFRPGALCPVYLGLPNFGTEGIEWGVDLQGKKVSLVYEIYDFFNSDVRAKRFTLSRIDVSRAYLPSRGQREVVLYIENQEKVQREEGIFLGHHTWILRLPREKYAARFYDFCTLVDALVEENISVRTSQPGEQRWQVVYPAKIIDLRIEDVCLIGG